MKCGKWLRFHLKSKYKLPIRLLYLRKLTCSLIVMIDPIICGSWKNTARSFPDMNRKPFYNGILPSSLLSIRLKNTNFNYVVQVRFDSSPTAIKMLELTDLLIVMIASPLRLNPDFHHTYFILWFDTDINSIEFSFSFVAARSVGLQNLNARLNHPELNVSYWNNNLFGLTDYQLSLESIPSQRFDQLHHLIKTSDKTTRNITILTFNHTTVLYATNTRWNDLENGRQHFFSENLMRTLFPESNLWQGSLYSYKLTLGAFARLEEYPAMTDPNIQDFPYYKRIRLVRIRFPDLVCRFWVTYRPLMVFPGCLSLC